MVSLVDSIEPKNKKASPLRGQTRLRWETITKLIMTSDSAVMKLGGCERTLEGGTLRYACVIAT